jgi:hypothetical protein
MQSVGPASTRELIALARIAARNCKDTPPPPPMAEPQPRRRPSTLRVAASASFIGAGLAGLVAMVA